MGEGVRESWGIRLHLVVQVLQLTCWVGQDDAEGDLAGVGEVRYAERMAHLGVETVTPRQRVRPCHTHPGQVSVEPVDSGPVDGQPAASIDPGTPRPGPGHLSVQPIDVACQSCQRGHVQWRAVVQAEVDVGLRCVITARSAASQEHPHDTVDLGQSRRHIA